jgi:hypothetical protein
MRSPDSGCHVCDLQIRRYPIEVGVRRKQTVEFIDMLMFGVPMGLHNELRHGDRRCYGGVTRPLDPRKDLVGESNVSRICLQLVDEDAGIRRDAFYDGAEMSVSASGPTLAFFLKVPFRIGTACQAADRGVMSLWFL